MVFNVALKPSGAISNSRLLISIALKSRGNLCGYSNEHAATVRSCSQRLRKQRFLSTWVMQSVLFPICDSLWLGVGAFSLASGSHQNSWHFYSKLQFVNFDEVIRIIIVQNTYCWVLTLARLACWHRPLHREHIEYWLVTQIPISGYGGWHTGPALNSPQTSHNSKLSFHDWIKIRRLQHTALHSHLELLFCLRERKSWIDISLTVRWTVHQQWPHC